MINRTFHVIRTYLSRPRFWVCGGSYLLCVAWWADNSVAFYLQVFSSAVLASITASFVALHLRRQFGGATAKLLPGFAAAHLTVAALASVTLWVAVPWLAAWCAGRPALGVIAVHAVAGMFLGLVVCWRQAILLLAAAPIFVISTRLAILEPSSSVHRFVAGQEPGAAAAFIALAIAAQVAAAVVLLRLSDHNVAASDDLMVDAARDDRVTGRLEELLLTYRDAVVRHRLADAGHGWWAIARWRIPVAVSWVQLALAVAGGSLLAAVTWYASGSVDGATVGVLAAVPMMLIAPFGFWHQRRSAMSLEFMRPVARPQYFREIAAAMAMDVTLWAAVASVFSTATMILLARHDAEAFYQFLFCQAAFIWGMAVLLFGMGLATFRLRYWILVMLGACLLWMLLTAPTLAAYARVLAALPGISPALASKSTGIVVPFAALFCATSALFGLLVAWLTYRHWLNADVT